MSRTIIEHATASETFNKDESYVDWHDETLWFVRQKRDKSSKLLPEWEQLREAASTIKNYVLSHMDTLLVSFEQKAKENGIHIHWATDAAEHNEIVLGLLRQHNIGKMVKSKSMLTEECHMNEFLSKSGIEVIDTDLGERIVQLRNEPPSHIVLPAIHLKKKDIGDLFHEHLGTEAGATDPQYLTEAARQHLRDKFLTRRAALTGVNFAIAETGGFVVATNEGNADMGAHLADIHIASMGFEKIIPKQEHLGVFLRLLARSATGQPVTTYSSHFKKPREGQEMHIIIVDNGRTTQLGRPDFRNSLKCIRCGACMNTCPVYRRSGGHSYHNAVAGPIGSILAPNLDMTKNADLPFASTLCGSCSNVCPVKIDIHDQLYKWRQVLVKGGHVPQSKELGIKAMSVILSQPRFYQWSGRLGRSVMRTIPFVVNNGLNPWFKQRDMPEPPKESFRDWYVRNRKA
ncbi:lactate utilization protein B [Dyadobacter sediminis]|uniref:Lactate utilization protein n=1 Tax=Dyadobacter sediminis TaxID=1493691 RepID=A0A5R9KF81_9BACT|nr:lactate utilization protein B [Dyadobacter sediminis]TLU94701.1 lactate utilization protein [Dyadobacter sediminis]GGB88928.1 4Fe-4S ferredoxin [Dyadobacter sediminis]